MFLFYISHIQIGRQSHFSICPCFYCVTGIRAPIRARHGAACAAQCLVVRWSVLAALPGGLSQAARLNVCILCISPPLSLFIISKFCSAYTAQSHYDYCPTSSALEDLQLLMDSRFPHILYLLYLYSNTYYIQASCILYYSSCFFFHFHVLWSCWLTFGHLLTVPRLRVTVRIIDI